MSLLVDDLDNYLDLFEDGKLVLPYIKTSGWSSQTKYSGMMHYILPEKQQVIENGKLCYFHRVTKWINSAISPREMTKIRHTYSYGRIISKNKKLLKADTTVDSGILPHRIKIMEYNNSPEKYVTLQWRGSRVGPDAIEFDLTDPTNNIHRYVSFGEHTDIPWNESMDAKYNFFGVDFFKNDTDKIEFIARGFG